MKNLLIIILLISGNCFGQVPADSLLGIYEGEYWYANPSTSTWVVTIDTVYVYTVDTINCKASVSGAMIGLPTIYTTYYSCNSPTPSNGYTLFFNEDSLKMIYDDMPQPPPNPHSISDRFYGKRIPGTTYVGLAEHKRNEEIEIFPNPVREVLNIRLPLEKGGGHINIYNIEGQNVKSLEIRSDNIDNPFILDIRSLAEGFYFL